MNKALFLAFIFLPIKLTPQIPNQFIVWDVGQGLWTTFYSENLNYCHHYDAGGEKAPFLKIKALCLLKNNLFFISHGDKDHISFLKWAKKTLKNPRYSKLIPHHQLTQKDKSLSRNNNSLVYLRSGVLLPGDIEAKTEKRISPKIKHKKIGYVLCPHHCSNTSSTKSFLKNFKAGTQFISSSRRKKYGHPHPKVVTRLKQFKLPLISTENWGNIFIRQ